MVSIQLLRNLYSKVLHDLSSPIGAVSNCVDLLDEKDEYVQKEAKKLVCSETKLLVQEMRLLKFIFEEHGVFPVEREEIKRHVHDFFSIKDKLKYELHIAHDLNNVDIKLLQSLFCILILLSEIIDSTKEASVLQIAFLEKQVSLQVPLDATLHIDRTNKKFRAAVDKATIENSYAYYAQLLLAEVGYKLDIELRSDHCEYIMTTKDEK